MPGGLTRVIQEDFSGGIQRAGTIERMPANAAYDITNGLLDRFGGVYRRGGGTYRSAAAFGSGLRFIWDGYLKHGHTTVVASTTSFGRLNDDRSITNIGGSGMATPGQSASYEGVLYLPGGATYDGEVGGVATKPAPYYAVVANRLLAASGNTIAFSKIGKPTEFDPTDFHQLPGGVEILGLRGLRSSAAVFTTAGVWVIGGLAKNLTDSSGNVQQSLDLYSSDFVLWGTGGVAAWEGALVAPSTEGVYLLSLGVTSEKSAPFVRISDSINDLYQGYVRSGYTAGQATVYENHYMLPIIGGGRVIDLLVCRLDLAQRGAVRPWTRLQGSGAEMAALATRVTSGASRTPELLGAEYNAGSRVHTLSYLEPSANTEHDADGSTPRFSLTTRSYPTGNLVPNTVTKLRMRYILVGPTMPHITAQTSAEGASAPSGAAWGAFAWGAGKWASSGEAVFEPLSGEAPLSTEGVKPFSWHPARKRRFVRFRLSCQSSTSQLAVRSLEIFVRSDGRL